MFSLSRLFFIYHKSCYEVSYSIVLTSNRHKSVKPWMLFILITQILLFSWRSVKILLSNFYLSIFPVLWQLSPSSETQTPFHSHWSASKCLIFMAARTPSIHVFLGRPLFLLSPGIHSIINFGILSSCILLTWPYHWSLFLAMMSIMSGFRLSRARGRNLGQKSHGPPGRGLMQRASSSLITKKQKMLKKATPNYVI